jgi:MFS family permease
VFLATRQGVAGLPRVIAFGGLLAGAALAAFSQSRSLPWSMLLMVAVGAGIILTAASVNTLVQHSVADDKRGRVMSLYTMTFLGIAPIGSLVLGHLAERWTAPVTLGVAGLLCVAGTGWYLGAVGRLQAALAAPSKREV